ncbi:flavodoxin family protein [Prevotella sp. PINT]|jgi:Multimeric flavodoxin WrbA|uniref:flavodoxin family protein n=1 Tax=Palleniella intestinalis TaxID=2736291 RepID=UPI001551E950|nr:flavodoxin family protein [Palleniella intestinalis]NPD81075.1 flavodoxin family protein [Palleniella intestinalis]
MNIVIINGSPRKDGNTALMCQAFADGAISQRHDATVETVNLYEAEFKGCRSCFACKLKDAPSYGKCAVKDNLSPILEKALKADILVLASPIYLMDVSGVCKSFLERLLFPLASYEAGYKSLATNRMLTVTIYTMNVPKEMCPEQVLANAEHFIGHVFRKPRRVCAYNTYQFRDYSKYKVEVFDERQKRRYHDEMFPLELKEAFDLGRELALAAEAEKSDCRHRSCDENP